MARVGRMASVGVVMLLTVLWCCPTSLAPPGEVRAAASTQVASYDVREATIQYGSVYSGSAYDLRDGDRVYFAVSSTTEYPYRVAWWTKVLCHVDKQAILRITLTFVARYSAPTNDQWIALWNFNTGNWEAVDSSVTSTTDTKRVWTTTDPAALGRFISKAGEIWVRVYNSKSDGTFVRYSDWLNVTVEYTPQSPGAECAATTVSAEYGVIVSGDYSSLAAQDGNYLALDSTQSSPYKGAWQATVAVGVDPNCISCLTVKYVGHQSTDQTNLLYLSLWNFRLGKWEVIRTFAPTTSDALQVWSAVDADELRCYVADTGEIRIRLYNSSSASPFTRYSDLLTVYLEHGTVRTFTFAHYTDVHQEADANPSLAYVIDDLNAYVAPAFAVNTGDTANHSRSSEFDSYVAQVSALGAERRETPGNHDVRWFCPNGKADWRHKLGQPAYQAFDFGGVHFVLLDTSVFMENDGAIAPDVLRWVRDDLAAAGTATPVILFGHHPRHDVAGLVDLLSAVGPYNVKCFLGGHDHVWEVRDENGIPWLGVDDVKYSTKYALVHVTPTHVKIYKRDPITHSSTLWLTIPMRKMPRTCPVAEVISVDPAMGCPTVRVTVVDPLYPAVAAEARVDGYGTWTPLVRDATGAWVGTIDVTSYTPPVPPGNHFVEVRVGDDYGDWWSTWATYQWADNTVSCWTFQTGGAIQAQPALHDGVVYVGSGDGRLYALRASDGLFLWSFATGGEIVSTPVMCPVGGRCFAVFGSGDGYVYAVDAQTGALAWRYATGGAVLSSPACDGSYVYVGAGDGKIYCLDATSGELRWSRQTGGLMRQRPWVSGGVLYAVVRDDDLWYALDCSTGALVWKASANADSMMPVCDNAPVLAAGKVWVVKPDYTFSALDAATGAVVWTESTADEFSARGPATDGAAVFISARSDTVYCFDAASGTVLWTSTLSAGSDDIQQKQVNSALVYRYGRLFRLAERGRLTVLDAGTGELLRTYDMGALPERNFWSTPAVDAEGVYAGGLDGKVYGLRWVTPP